MSEDEEEAAEEAEAEEAEEVPRRDPGEKQEPHTVMWGNSSNIRRYICIS